MTLTATDAAAHGGLTVQWGADDRRPTPPTIPSQKARPPAAVRSVLICDARPGARAALTLRVTAAVPSVNDITCAARPANLIATFAGRPRRRRRQSPGTPRADLVFIGMESEPGIGVDAADVFLRRYPDAGDRVGKAPR